MLILFSHIDVQSATWLVDLAYAANLRSVTLDASARIMPLRLAVLAQVVLSKLPHDVCPTELIVNVHSGIDSARQVGVTWRLLFPNILAHVSFDPRLSVTVRLKYPLKWDQYLVEGLSALMALTPCRLEYTTKEGVIKRYTIPEAPNVTSE